VSDRGHQRGDATEDVDEVDGRQDRTGLGCGGVQKHETGGVVRELGGEALDVEAAEGVAGEHVGAGDPGALEQRVQVGGDLHTVLWAVSSVAPAPAGPVVDA
jgi:hypothetical protein